MISVETAKSLLSEFVPNRRTVTIEMVDSAGFVLAEDVYSPIDMPPFPQSAMDGYALGLGSKNVGSTFKVIDEIEAGSSKRIELESGEAVRIFTGAAVPESTTAVVQQEWVTATESTIALTQNVADRMHIRPQGEQMKTNDLALAAGSTITPGAIGFLSMLGITTVSVFQKPQLSVLVTGNELVSPGNRLEFGKVYESNSQMLKSALLAEGIVSKSGRIADNLEDTIDALGKAISASDIVMITGGISVGDYDHVGTAMTKLGVSEVFYKVAQKPGKPIYFGTKNGKAIFALPGNPAASLTCYYEYVLPIIRRFYGRSDEHLATLKLPLAEGNTIKPIGRAQFLKALIKKNEVQILEGQSSAMLNSFALANALVYAEANCNQLAAGNLVVAHLLP